MTFAELLTRQGEPFRPGSGPNEVFVCCPFCVDQKENEDRRFRLGINSRDGRGHCFNCGWSSKKHAVTAFLQRRNLKLTGKLEESSKVTSKEKLPVRLPEDFHVLSRCRDSLDRRARCYLLRRGVTKRQIATQRIGISLSGLYAYRVIFPIRFQGELLGFVGRDFTGLTSRRYMNSIGEHKGLYNLPNATKNVILMEGVFKALRVEQVVKGWSCCGVLGSTVTTFQVEQLKEVGCRRVVVWPDPDGPGVRGALRSIKTLQPFDVRVVRPSCLADEVPLQRIQEVWECNVHKANWGQTIRALLAG